MKKVDIEEATVSAAMRIATNIGYSLRSIACEMAGYDGEDATVLKHCMLLVIKEVLESEEETPEGILPD